MYWEIEFKEDEGIYEWTEFHDDINGELKFKIYKYREKNQLHGYRFSVFCWGNFVDFLKEHYNPDYGLVRKDIYGTINFEVLVNELEEALGLVYSMKEFFTKQKA